MEMLEKNKAIDMCAERILESGVQPLQISFKPVFDCFSAETVAYVGETKIAGGTLGFLTSKEYLPVVDKSGNGLEVLEATLESFAEEVAFFKPDLYRVEFFSFPAAIGVLKDENLYDSLFAFTKNNPELKDKICLAFDGKILKEDEELLLKAFSDIRSAGLKIAINDFGDKYMPLSLLGTVTPDYLFLKEAETAKAEDKKTFAPVGALIKYATNLGIKTVAENAKTDKGIRELSLAECFGATVCEDYKGLRAGGEEQTLENIIQQKEGSE